MRTVMAISCPARVVAAGYPLGVAGLSGKRPGRASCPAGVPFATSPKRTARHITRPHHHRKDKRKHAVLVAQCLHIADIDDHLRARLDVRIRLRADVGHAPDRAGWRRDRRTWRLRRSCALVLSPGPGPRSAGRPRSSSCRPRRDCAAAGRRRRPRSCGPVDWRRSAHMDAGDGAGDVRLDIRVLEGARTVYLAVGPANGVLRRIESWRAGHGFLAEWCSRLPRRRTIEIATLTSATTSRIGLTLLRRAKCRFTGCS